MFFVNIFRISYHGQNATHFYRKGRTTGNIIGFVVLLLICARDSFGYVNSYAVMTSTLLMVVSTCFMIAPAISSSCFVGTLRLCYVSQADGTGLSKWENHAADPPVFMNFGGTNWSFI